jgi:hypothetical protein
MRHSMVFVQRLLTWVQGVVRNCRHVKAGRLHRLESQLRIAGAVRQQRVVMQIAVHQAHAGEQFRAAPGLGQWGGCVRRRLSLRDEKRNHVRFLLGRTRVRPGFLARGGGAVRRLTCYSHAVNPWTEFAPAPDRYTRPNQPGYPTTAQPCCAAMSRTGNHSFSDASPGATCVATDCGVAGQAPP